MTARMTLRDWRPIGKGALLGRCDIELPNGLQANDVAVFAKDGRRWATMPAEMLRDAEGQPLKDERGKVRYRTQLRWNSRDLQERWGQAVIDLIEERHGAIGGGQ